MKPDLPDLFMQSAFEEKNQCVESLALRGRAGSLMRCEKRKELLDPVNAAVLDIAGVYEFFEGSAPPPVSFFCPPKKMLLSTGTHEFSFPAYFSQIVSC